ncbi:hypothetical protein TRIATDRAFT_159039 [Trichoderma atroviride IMI 206040]|uniref:Uncharacterized protein n=1 Tax=Hypocrea atroviridis (strain ATCC 20476 / IMI 206040) TaxID=452589 RepID=G9P7G0_HYPAI|nr:uncharacterized protein TRIATDRAFT_159039 [Trichoderma atroviride IMI 206040]EHK40775.1 hypothetical protein TRIATDRAFT_159039 [Trichoderma atroviride IMI 206040]
MKGDVPGAVWCVLGQALRCSDKLLATAGGREVALYPRYGNGKSLKLARQVHLQAPGISHKPGDSSLC